MGPQFHETVMGRRFFEGQLPRLIKALEQIAERKDATSFTYNGKQFQLSAEEIEAAYRYQRKNYLRADADCHITELFDHGMISLDHKELCMEYIDAISEQFDNKYDCDIDENSQWETLILEFIREHLESERRGHHG